MGEQSLGLVPGSLANEKMDHGRTQITKINEVIVIRK
jgi:hypothetical protein